MHRALFGVFAIFVGCGPSSKPLGATPTSIAPVIGPGGDATSATDLGETKCGARNVNDALPSSCVPLHGTAMSSGADLPPVTEAFDGDVCTIWNAGGPAPRGAAEDFGQKRVVASLVLVPSMEKNGRMRNVIEASDDGITYHTMYIVDQDMLSGHAYEVKIPTPFAARAVRVSTTDAPGFVAWKDVVALECKM